MAQKINPPVEQIPQVQQMQANNVNLQQAQMSNAQQQQLYNYQQQQQQMPQMMPNQLMNNAQQQMQMNSNMNQAPNMQIPIQQMAPMSNVGVYGRQRTREPMDMQLPALFNDDEQFVESVKEVGKEAKIEVSLVAQRSQVKMG